MDALSFLALPVRPLMSLCRVPEDLEAVTDVGVEVPGRDVGVGHGALEGVWRSIENLYRTGLYPAIQVCVRRRGAVVLQRAIGHARGNQPGADPDAPQQSVTTATPFNLFSASKAITAMVIHKLDEERVLHLEDRVCDWIPEFGAHGKDRITLRHVLCHRSGIPNLPAGALDLDLLSKPEEIVEILCAARPVSRPGRRLAYHAVTGGFVLGEVVRRATGKDIRAVMREKFQEPLGLRWMNYGVDACDLPFVAEDAFTGLPVPPPVSWILQRALGAAMRDVVTMSNDPRFRTGIIPAANIISTADEAASFYQCLLEEGTLGGVRVLDPRTVRHATSEQSYWELDLTLGVPLRHGLGFMLGADLLSLFGPDTSRAFGHLGFTNILTWADPERDLVVALLTSGKPFVSPEVLRLYEFLLRLQWAFSKV